MENKMDTRDRIRATRVQGLYWRVPDSLFFVGILSLQIQELCINGHGTEASTGWLIQP